MKKFVGSLLKEVVLEMYGIALDNPEKLIEIPPDSELGDFSFPCFVLSKSLRKNPHELAEELKASFNTAKQGKGGKSSNPWLLEARAAGGYLNVVIDRDYFAAKVMREAGEENYGCSGAGAGQTICMDYSSPNIAKNFHVGHLRTTIIGNSLARIFSKQGYQVVRINHLGDWGTQFGKLIVAFKRWSSRESVEEKGIEELMRIYVRFSHEAETEPALQEEARLWFARMERAKLMPEKASAEDQEALAIWEWFRKISIKEFERVYRILKVEFDSYTGESFYMDQVPALVQELKEKKLLQESEGANIISLEEYGMPPCLITKKDGSSIYHSRDIAAALYRKKMYHFTKCLYITGAEQKLHFMQVFKALELMGYDWAKDCRHIPYGLVSMGGEKLSTRKGNIVYAEDILEEAISRAQTAITEKNPELPDKETAAGKIGVGAVIFHDLANQLSRDVEFRWEAVLNFDGMTAPYIQYTYARACSILRKAGSLEQEIDFHVLTEDAAYELLKQLSRYQEAICEAAEKYEPCIVARYVYNLAVLFNKFYQECRIIGEETGVKQARAALTQAVQKVIGDAMGLLGIECPEEM